MKYQKKLTNIPQNKSRSPPNTHPTENGIDHRRKYHNHNPITIEIARLYSDLENDSKNLYEI